MESMVDIVDFDSFEKLLDSGNNTPKGRQSSASLFTASEMMTTTYSQPNDYRWNASSNSHSGLSLPPPGFVGSDQRSDQRPPLGSVKTSPGSYHPPPMFTSNSMVPSKSSSPPSALFSTPTASPRHQFYPPASSSSPPLATTQSKFALPMTDLPGHSTTQVYDRNVGLEDSNDADFLDMLTMPWEDMEDRFGSISRISGLDSSSVGVQNQSSFGGFSSDTSSSGSMLSLGSLTGLGGAGSGHGMSNLGNSSSTFINFSKQLPGPSFAPYSSNSVSNTANNNVQTFAPVGLPRDVSLTSGHTNIAPSLSSMALSPSRNSVTHNTNIRQVSGATNMGNSGGNNSLKSSPMLQQQEENLFYGANGIFGIQPSTSSSVGQGGASLKAAIPISSSNISIAPGLSPPPFSVLSGSSTGSSAIPQHDFGKDIYFSHYSQSQKKSADRKKTSTRDMSNK